MELILKRIYTCSGYTIGHLYVDNVYLCDTLEDTDRGLSQDMTVEQIKKIKIQDRTAIPIGIYNILMNIVSPKYSKKQYYMDICKGKVPRLDNVKGYQGVLIHVGNDQYDTSGCILVGLNKVKGKVLYSKSTFEKLYKILKGAYDKGDTISLKIVRSY